MTLDSELWRRARPLFDELVELDSTGRKIRLDEISLIDPLLRKTLESLLHVDAGDQDPLHLYNFAPSHHDRAMPATDLRDPLGMIGSTVSNFRITGFVAAGGMGVVYRAEDFRLERTVALKFPAPHGEITNEVKERLLREGRAVALLDHPNLCAIYDIGESAHGVFLAMPLYAGETLKDRLAREHTLPIDDAIGISRQIATGLAFAHDAGIVHRDLKPGNIMLLPNGSVKILDFGLAKVSELSQSKSHATLGTVAYMAPEQIRGNGVDGRADLWAIGVMLYEMLTGVPPFHREHELSLLHSILHEQPDRPSKLNGNVSRQLDQLTTALLSKDRSHRYQSAKSLLTDLDALDRGRALSHRVPLWAHAWQRKRVRISILAGSAVFALVVFGVLSWRLGQSNPSSTTIDSPVFQTLAVLPFANGKPDSTAEYVVSGFSDGFVSRLSVARGLSIAGRASTSALQVRKLSPREVGRQLGVANVLAGSVRTTAESLYTSVQLRRVSDNTALWSRDFKAPLSEIMALQQQLADSLLSVMQLRSARSMRPPTHDPYAYQLYSMARYSWEGRTLQKYEDALRLYHDAVARDPQFALAWAAMAEAYVNMSNFGYMSKDQALKFAELASGKSVEIDTTLAEAYNARGQLLMSEGNYGAAELSLKRAINLDRNDPWARHYYALLLAMQGRFDEAKKETQKTLTFDPLSVPGNANLGIFIAREGKWDEARIQFDQARKLGPNYIVTLYYFGALEASLGNYQTAAELFEKAMRIGPNFTGVRGALAYTYEQLGRHAEAERLLTETRKHAIDERSRTDYALSLAITGNFDSAFAILQTIRWDIPTLIDLRVDPLLRRFRSDPRYPRLIARAGLRP